MLCPGCGTPDCPDGVPAHQRSTGCPDCTPDLHSGDRPPGWTDDDEATHQRLTAQLIAETDYDLIDRLNAEYLDLLNDPTDDDADDP